MTKIKSKCKECKHFEEVDLEEYGAEGMCHRFPPVFTGINIVGNVSEARYSFPLVFNDEWCGEYLMSV